MIEHPLILWLGFFLRSGVWLAALAPVPAPTPNAPTTYYTPGGAFVLDRHPDEAALFRRHRDQLARFNLESGAAAFRLRETGAVLISDGWLLIALGAGVDEQEVADQLETLGAQHFVVFDPQRRLARAWVSPERAPEAAARLHREPALRWAHPDFIYRAETRAVPNDPIYPEQWHHGIIRSEAAWDRERGDVSVRIAVIDSGADLSHPDLSSQWVAPRDTENQDDDPSPEPGEGHGTACAGIAGAQGNNGLGVTGVCQECTLVPIRFFPGNGFTRAGADSDAFYWALEQNVAVISNSWGPSEQVPVPFSLDEAITAAATESRLGLGAVILFAAGNTAEENLDFELESHPLVLAVGASSISDEREPYSNFGSGLDLLAPAASVTTDVQGADGYVEGDYIRVFGGTSAATPVVAGVAGLIASADPSLTREQITNVLLSTTDRIGTDPYLDGRNDFYGYGRVNAARALELVVTGEVCIPAPEDCDNGSDDDCDFLVDREDRDCAPGAGEACAGAGGECRDGNVCLPEEQGASVYRCFKTCEEQSECEGQECVPVSNELSVCSDAQFVACPTCGTLTCDTDSLCVTYSDLSLSLCTPSCATATDCPVGFYCSPVGGGSRACAPLSFTCSAFAPGPGSPCGVGDSCALGNLCLNDGLCYPACASDTDCLAQADCVDTSIPGFRYCDCECDTSGGCERDCPCDLDCDSGCQCDESESCDPGCPCDSDCETPVGCGCDLSDSCDAGCACDEECDEKPGEQSDGCAALPNGIPWGLAVLLGLYRRRFIRRSRLGVAKPEDLPPPVVRSRARP